jgi:hypothetical protein
MTASSAGSDDRVASARVGPTEDSIPAAKEAGDADYDFGAGRLARVTCASLGASPRCRGRGADAGRSNPAGGTLYIWFIRVFRG